MLDNLMRDDLFARSSDCSAFRLPASNLEFRAFMGFAILFHCSKSFKYYFKSWKTPLNIMKFFNVNLLTARK